MSSVFDTNNYEFTALSIPFVVASVAVVLLGLYVLFMNAALALRVALAVIVVGLFPFLVGSALVASTDDADVAMHIYRISIALLPLASTGVLLFELTLAQRLRQHRFLIAFAVVSSIVLAVVCMTTDVMVTGIWTTSVGLMYFKIGILGPLQLAAIGVWVAVGIVLLRRRLNVEPSSVRRRQMKQSMVAFAVCVAGVVDTPLGYGFGWFPVSWLFLTVGSFLVLRSVVVDDLFHARALDSRAPLALLFLILGAAGVWIIRRELGPDASVFVAALMIVGLFLTLRLATTLMNVMSRASTAPDETPLERAAEVFVTNVRSMKVESEIGEATVSVVNLGLGSEPVKLLWREKGSTWESTEGDDLDAAAVPNTLVSDWLVHNNRPLTRDDIETARQPGAREPIKQMFELHRAEVLVPLVDRTDLVGLLTVGAPSTGRAYRNEEVRFLANIKEHATNALCYAQMQREATARVEVGKDVELAAAVQGAFVPSEDTIHCGRVSLAGMYTPASRCGGDWWSVHEVPDGRVLVLVGDVTGHGIAAAMVTAAAKGCYDVAQHLMGNDLDLPRLLVHLDAAVRKAGNGEFFMTCFATLIDPDAGKVYFSNAGHVVPYLCHPGDGGKLELDALVARGNPLGAGEKPAYKTTERPISRGDIFIWYTDGIVECTNEKRVQFGDRRMQRVIRKLNGETASVQGIRDHVVNASLEFQDGYPADDDITLVVGRVT